MAGENTTLKQTLREVVGETQETPKTEPKQTVEEVSKSQSDETKSGETPEYVAGIDISDIPEQDRPRIKAKLEEKAKLLEKGYQPKFQKVAKLEKSLEWLSQQGITSEEAETQLMKYAEQKKNPVQVIQEKKAAVNTLDKLIEEAPYEQKDSLQKMRKIILEETGAEDFKKELADLRKVVGYFQTKDLQLGEIQIKSELQSLSEKFGKDFISKYEDTVLSEWRKYPQSQARNILKYVVPDEEYEQAIVSSKTKQIKTREKAEAVTSAGSGVTSSSETIDTKGRWRDTIKQVINLKK